MARRFAQVLRRQTSLNHLCQAARSVLQSAEITGQLLEDWLSVDLNSIVKQTLYTMDQYTYRDHTLTTSSNPNSVWYVFSYECHCSVRQESNFESSAYSSLLYDYILLNLYSTMVACVNMTH